MEIGVQKPKTVLIVDNEAIIRDLCKRALDEYRLIVNPVVLGAGKSLFTGITDRLNLRLLDTEALGSGNVLLRYQSAGGR